MSNLELKINYLINTTIVKKYNNTNKAEISREEIMDGFIGSIQASEVTMNPITLLVKRQLRTSIFSEREGKYEFL